MKPTANKAMIASRKQTRRIFSLACDKPVWSAMALVLVLVMSFFVGRVSAPQQNRLEQAIAELRLEVLLQQRDVDRFIQENHGNINFKSIFPAN